MNLQDGMGAVAKLTGVKIVHGEIVASTSFASNPHWGAGIKERVAYPFEEQECDRRASGGHAGETIQPLASADQEVGTSLAVHLQCWHYLIPWVAAWGS